MNTKKFVLFLYGETTLHAGTGVGLGAVDLPIQRERHTGYPMIQASSVKGALRNAVELYFSEDDKVRNIFGGASGENEGEFAGALSPSDARILLFPVRALQGVFVWVTSPAVLARFKQEAAAPSADMPKVPQNGEKVWASDNGMLLGNQIMLEEYTYSAEFNDLAKQWAAYLAEEALPEGMDAYWRERLQTHLAILPDDAFRDFVRYSTEIVTRIHVDDVKKTVKKGQLFTQELLPADSLLYSVVRVTDSRGSDMKVDGVVASLQEAIGERVQVGADETVGRGRMWLRWMEVKA